MSHERKNNSLLNKWLSLPEWARWILYLPAIICIPALIMFCLLAPNILFFNLSEFGKFFFRIPAGIMSAGYFIYLSFELAPRFKIAIGWSIFLIISVFSGIYLIVCIYMMHSNGFKWATVGDMIQTFIWFPVGIIVIRAYDTDAINEAIK
ncbi:MAG: hypothetical protein PSX71_08755 [bacterium]|nr:hypothetical protein [bacterium]